MTDKQDSPELKGDVVPSKIAAILWDFRNTVQARGSAIKWVDQIIALYAPVIEQALQEGVEKATVACNSTFDSMIKEAVKAEHDRMIKRCVDEGNDAFKRGVKDGKVRGAEKALVDVRTKLIKAMDEMPEIKGGKAAAVVLCIIRGLRQDNKLKGDTP